MMIFWIGLCHVAGIKDEVRAETGRWRSRSTFLVGREVGSMHMRLCKQDEVGVESSGLLGAGVIVPRLPYVPKTRERPDSMTRGEVYPTQAY